MGSSASVPPPPPVKSGDVVAGKYRVERAIAAGGMGLVFAAKHMELDQAVALKFMRAELRGQISASRFTLEARATAKLRSPHVAKVYDVGVLEDGTPFMVMELLEGIDLEMLLEERGRITADVAAELVTQACEAVSEAHDAGIIHRDLKPANLFLTKTRQGTPFVKVLDFGISKATKDAVSSSATAAGTIIGSPPYMSPETLKSSRNADARSDIWSLGVILYELVTGRLPFEGEGIGDMALKAHHEEPIWPMGYVPDIPKAFDDIVRACLQKDAANRFASVTALRDALIAFSSSRESLTSGMTLSMRSSQPRFVVVVDEPASARTEPPPPPTTTPRTAERLERARAATTIVHQTEAEKAAEADEAIRSVRSAGRNPKFLALAAALGAAVTAALAIVVASRSAVSPVSAAVAPPETVVMTTIVSRPPEPPPTTEPTPTPTPTLTTTAATTATTTPAVVAAAHPPHVTTVSGAPKAPPDKAGAAAPKEPPAPTAAVSLTPSPPPMQPSSSPPAGGRTIRDRGF